MAQTFNEWAIAFFQRMATAARGTAADPNYVVQQSGSQAPLAYVQMTSLGTATTLNSIPGTATQAIVQPETQSVRWRLDGTNPTASVGMVLTAGSELVINGAAAIAAIKFIESTASAKLNISYFA